MQLLLCSFFREEPGRDGGDQGQREVSTEQKNRKKTRKEGLNSYLDEESTKDITPFGKRQKTFVVQEELNCPITTRTFVVCHNTWTEIIRPMCKIFNEPIIVHPRESKGKNRTEQSVKVGNGTYRRGLNLFLQSILSLFVLPFSLLIKNLTA